MAEAERNGKIRIRTGEHPHETTVTDAEGKPLDTVLAATWHQRGGDLPTVSLQFYHPEIEVAGELVDLERLAAAEAVCRGLTAALRSPLASFPPAVRSQLWRAVDAWRESAGKEPIEWPLQGETPCEFEPRIHLAPGLNAEDIRERLLALVSDAVKQAFP